jgi:hypothetical protein
VNLVELYAKTPVEEHREIVISGDRVFFNVEEYIIDSDSNLRLIRSQKGLEQKLAELKTILTR